MIPIVTTVSKRGKEESDLMSHEFNQRIIRITGDIDDAMADEVSAKISYLDSIGKEPIKVIVNSGGGTVSSGLVILDSMKGAKSEIHVVCTGMAASMAAFLVACGGEKGHRYITPNAEMMIHQPLGGVSGQASDVQLAAEHIIRIKKRITFLLAEATGKTEKQISRDIDRDLWLDAHEAVAYGLVDRIV